MCDGLDTFLAYQPLDKNKKSHALRGESLMPTFSPNLSWTHYRLIMRITRPEARMFYEHEASKNHWSSRELERQISSLLFDRLAKSKDKEGLLRLAYKGQEIMNPVDSIKEPIVLEFLGIPESHRLVESKLEEALINNLQTFLLEMGKGFALFIDTSLQTLEISLQIQTLQQRAKAGERKSQLVRDFHISRETLYQYLKSAA